MKRLLLITVLAAMALAGCKKEKTQPPTCTITAPANNAEFLVTENITVAVTADVKSGNIAEVRLYVDNVGQSSKTAFPYNFTINAGELTAGSHTLKAEAIDNSGAKAESTVTISVLHDPLTYDGGVLIGGVKWATRNVDKPGTFAATPQSSGMFYQWNRKIGWSAADPLINSNNGAAWDNSYALGSSWTKANDPCPAGWRVPTQAELSLLTGGIWTDTPAGRTFGGGANTLFLPAVGYRGYWDGRLYDVGSSGRYWSATLSTSFTDNGCAFSFDNSNSSLLSNAVGVKSMGYSVRCVAE